MSHWSEDAHQLKVVQEFSDGSDGVCVFWLSSSPTLTVLERLRNEIECLGDNAVVGVVTSPEAAAALLPSLESIVKFQLWVAVQVDDAVDVQGHIPAHHAALLLLSRYSNSLRHTKTRIRYTYCPSCGKTTKDYGGKKHIYHEYGTLISDVWRDITINLGTNIDPVVNRLRDLFGIEPHSELIVRDWHKEIQVDKYVSITKQETNEVLITNKLINGDCLAELSTLSDNSIDFCFADPPYNIKKRYDHWDDSLEIQEYFSWCDLWLSELYRVLKPGHTLAVLNIPQWNVRHLTHLSTLPGAQFQNWIVWDSLSLPVRMIMPAHYGILCVTKGISRSIPMTPHKALSPMKSGYCLRSTCVKNRNRNGQNDREPLSDLWSDVHRLKHNSRRVEHPCQLPPLLMERLIAVFTLPNEVVLDPFNGSGTTTLVAVQMQRRFIGIEISETYDLLTRNRHNELEYGIDPFRKNDVTPIVKNSHVPRVKKQKYEVSKKKLQLEVRRIAQELGHIPDREEVAANAAYPLELFETYFPSWASVTAAARTTGMTDTPIDSQSSLFASDD